MRKVVAVGVIVKGLNGSRAALIKHHRHHPVTITRQSVDHLERITNHFDMPQLKVSIGNAERLLLQKPKRK